MILWASQVETEAEAQFPELGRRAWRWVLEAGRWSQGVSIGFTKQVLFDGEQWCAAHHYYDVSLTKHFRLGESHDYYDGPHCAFSLGWLHINWSGAWCTKCMPEKE